jgi:hypothetical protein
MVRQAAPHSVASICMTKGGLATPFVNGFRCFSFIVSSGENLS